MKTTHRIKTAFAALASVAALLSSASAGTTWYYGASDNSATFGVTADTSQAITWADAWGGGSAPDTNFQGSQSLQVSRPDMLGLEQSIILYGFAGTGLSASSVASAMLYLRSDFSFQFGSPNTWTIMGLSPGNGAFDTSAMTYNDLSTSTALDWSGTETTMLSAMTGTTYGTFSDLGTDVDGNVAINITAALQAYLNGTISGIAFVNSTNGDSFSSTDYMFSPYSNESTTATNRPGLLVTTVPEPSVSLLGLFGVTGLALRRRRSN
jgi:MYXO-CTERM domain-containing protein